MFILAMQPESKLIKRHFAQSKRDAVKLIKRCVNPAEGFWGLVLMNLVLDFKNPKQ